MNIQSHVRIYLWLDRSRLLSLLFFLVQRLVLVSICSADLRLELQHCWSVNLFFTITEWIFCAFDMQFGHESFTDQKSLSRRIDSINQLFFSFFSALTQLGPNQKSSRQTNRKKKNNSKRNKRNILAYLISAVLHSKTVDSNQLEKRNNQVGEFYQAKGGGGRENDNTHTQPTNRK